MAGYPRLQDRHRRLVRERVTLEKFRDNIEHDPQVGRTTADTIASLEKVDAEIHELEQVFLFIQIWTIAIWLLPAILFIISLITVAVGLG